LKRKRVEEEEIEEEIEEDMRKENEDTRSLISVAKQAIGRELSNQPHMDTKGVNPPLGSGVCEPLLSMHSCGPFV
jgi:hypothetical protein